MKLKSFVKSGNRLNCIKMARILLVTDSNFINNIGDYKGRKIKNLEVKSCQSRKAVLQELAGVDEGIVVFSCLDMMAADIAATTLNGADAAVELYINQFLYKIMDKVNETEGKVYYGVAAPLFWTSHSQPVSRAMNHAFKSQKQTPIDHVWLSDYFREVRAGLDGVHLTRQSADRFIRHIFDFFCHINEASGQKLIEFESQPEDAPPSVRTPGRLSAPPMGPSGLDWAEENSRMQVEDGQLLGPPEDETSPARTTSMRSESLLEPTRQNSGSISAYANTQSRLIRLANPYINPFPDLSIPPPSSMMSQNAGQNNSSMEKLERRIGSLESRSFYCDLMTAGLKEELDTEANKAMLNRVSVSGVDLPDLHRMNEVDKVKAMKTKIKEIFDLLTTPETYEVKFVRHLNNQIRGAKLAVIEVKLAEAQQAKLIRAEFVKKRKELSDKLNISPVVRLATRVRIEIMHSVADLLKRYDRTVSSAYCLQYIPKPVIKIVRKSQAGTESIRTMSFCEAVGWVQEKGLRNVIDLRKARERAGATHRATLSQHFVILD